MNYATAFLDLDFVYGRSEEDAATLRSSDGNGFMAVTEKGLPYLNDDGTWLVCLVRLYSPSFEGRFSW